MGTRKSERLRLVEDEGSVLVSTFIRQSAAGFCHIEMGATKKDKCPSFFLRAVPLERSLFFSFQLHEAKCANAHLASLEWAPERVGSGLSKMKTARVVGTDACSWSFCLI